MISHLDKAVPPANWPAPPNMVSFSAMSDMESCPRKWALAQAQYPDIWNQSGYPRAMGYGNAKGQITHMSVELLVKALESNGCSDLRSKEAVEAIRGLGGFTKLIEDVRNRFIQEQTLNPRMEKTLPELERRLIKDAPDQISLVRNMLIQSGLTGAVQIADSPVEEEDYSTSEATRNQLGIGSHPEVFLRSEEIGWIGIADLITIGPDLCEIRDFKTGGEEIYHENQLKIYAALWYQDKRLNPKSKLANRLTLSYPHRDVEIPSPTLAEVDHLLIDLKERAYTAKAALLENPPKAVASADNCRWCSVKQLCDAYWIESTQQNLFSETQEETQFIDAQIKLENRRDALVWHGTVDCGRELDSGDQVTIMLQAPDEDLRAGRTIRIIGARTLSGDNGGGQDDGIPSIEFISTTERYFYDV